MRGSRPRAAQASPRIASASATRAGSGGRFTSQPSAWRATTSRSAFERPAATWIGIRSAGARTRARSSATKRPRRVTSSPRQSARTASRVSSSQAMRSPAAGSGRPKRRSAGCPPMETKSRTRPGGGARGSPSPGRASPRSSGGPVGSRRSLCARCAREGLQSRRARRAPRRRGGPASCDTSPSTKTAAKPKRLGEPHELEERFEGDRCASRGRRRASTQPAHAVMAPACSRASALFASRSSPLQTSSRARVEGHLHHLDHLVRVVARGDLGSRSKAAKRWITSSVKPGVVQIEPSGSRRPARRPASSSSSRAAQTSGRLAVELARRHLPDRAAGGVAELADQQHVALAREGHHRRRARVPHDVERDALAVRQLDLVLDAIERRRSGRGEATRASRAAAPSASCGGAGHGHSAAQRARFAARPARARSRRAVVDDLVR